jgi:DNA-binding XRE family transcriptional regulator
MGKRMRARLETARRVGSAEEVLAEFLGLSPAEVTYLEIRLTLAGRIRGLRARAGLTQAELAAVMGSSQSRVARMEAADPSVTTDLMLKALLALGATRQQVAETIAAPLVGVDV